MQSSFIRRSTNRKQGVKETRQANLTFMVP